MRHRRITPRRAVIGSLTATALLVAAGAAPAQQNKAAYQPQLSELMGIIQLDHAKLWFAGRNRNWPLATYQLEKLNNDLSRAAIMYSQVPVEQIGLAETPLKDLQEAINRKDTAAYARAFNSLTAVCNSCHQSIGRAFIHIVTPTRPPLDNQQLTPPK